MNLSTKFSAGLLSAASFLFIGFFPFGASAGDNGDPSATAATLPNPLNVSSISDVLYLIANIATYIGVILAVLALIWVGFKFVAAQGNSEKITEAKRYFFYIIIGVAILIGASAIISILKTTLSSAGVVQPCTFSNPGC
jgi:hypothetical protein